MFVRFEVLVNLLCKINIVLMLNILYTSISIGDGHAIMVRTLKSPVTGQMADSFKGDWLASSSPSHSLSFM